MPELADLPSVDVARPGRGRFQLPPKNSDGVVLDDRRSIEQLVLLLREVNEGTECDRGNRGLTQ